jgi:hypothetical protein
MSHGLLAAYLSLERALRVNSQLFAATRGCKAVIGDRHVRVSFALSRSATTNDRKLELDPALSAKSGHCDDLLTYSKVAVPSPAVSADFAMLGGIGDRNRVAIRRKN